MIEELGSSIHRLDWQTKRNALNFTAAWAKMIIKSLSGSERSADREEAYRALQVRELLMRGNDAKEPSSAEEVDLGFIDLAESDPAHCRQAHANKRLSPQWTVEEAIEMKGLFDRGCLHKVKKNELPTGHESSGHVSSIRSSGITP
jgi:hypothetical protein